MEYGGEGVEALVSAVEALNNANIITADNRLKSLLKCLAFYDEFRDVLTRCTLGYDYSVEKERVFQVSGERKILSLPRGIKQIVAFVSNFLLEADSGAVNLFTFADAYFPTDTSKQSYEQFFDAVVEPFKIALVKLTVEGFDEEPQKRNIEFAADGLQRQTEHLLISIVEAVKDAKLQEAERVEFTVMLEGLSFALDTKDTLMIRAVWTGLKKALKAAGLCNREVAATDEVFKLYMILK